MIKEELSSIDKTLLPKHVGIIMDGNGRWAQKKGLPRSAGHKEGAKVFKKICDYGYDLGIKYMTFYAFSTENWKRPKAEIEAIMSLFREYVLEAEETDSKSGKKGRAIKFIGDISKVPADIFLNAQRLEKKSQGRDIMTINLAVNYGGQQEILKAVKEIGKDIEDGKLKSKNITLEDIEKRLYTSGQPMPDLIIRPSGEYRLSNFMTWQSAYSEFWYSDILWPDFTTDNFDEAIKAYVGRNRRFGGV